MLWTGPGHILRPPAILLTLLSVCTCTPALQASSQASRSLLNGVLLSTAFAATQDTEQATRQFAVAVGFQNQKLYDSAIEEWQTFLQKYPGDSRVPRATHYLGTCQLQAKQYAQATATLEGLLASSPKFEMLDQTLLNLGTAWYSIAQQSAKPDEYAKAMLSFERLAKEFPESEFAGRAAFYRAESLYHQNKRDEAIAAYRDMIRGFPKDELLPDAIYALGVCQEESKQFKEAQASFSEFQKRFPKHSLLTEVQMRQAECLFAEDRFAEAMKLFAAVTSVKEFALADTAMLRQARCLYELDRYEEAGAVYWNVPRQFTKTKLYDAAVLAGAKCYYLAGKYAQARSGLENVAKRNVPEAAEASLWIARSLLKEKNPQQALSVLDAALDQHARDKVLPQLILARIDTLYELPDRRAETVALYAKFAQKFPDEELASQAGYMSALTALDLGDHGSAKTSSEAFLKQFPGDRLAPDVQFISAEARLLLREFADAAVAYREFLKASPGHASADVARVRLGLSLQLAGRNEEALTELQGAAEMLKDQGLKSEALAVSGRCFLALEQLDKAVAAFEKSLQTDARREQSDQTLLILADVYRRMNRTSEQAITLNRLKREFPGSRLVEEASFRLGESAFAAEKYDDAIARYSEVISGSPKGEFAPHAQYGLSWALFRKGDYAKAIEAAQTLNELHPGSESAGRVLYVKAMAEFQQTQYADAVESVNQFLKTDRTGKEMLDAKYLLGLALAGQEKFADAAATYTALLKTDPAYADADKVLYELGWAYFELGRQNESVAAFRKLGTDFPDSPLAAESLFRVAESLYESEKYAEAAQGYSETISRAGTGDLGEKAAHKLAWSYFRSNKLSEAAAAFGTQLKSWPNGPLAGDARFLLGECAYKQKQWNEALKQYSAVIKARHPVYQALALYRSGEAAAATEDWQRSLQFHEQVLAGFPAFELKAEARYGAGWALQQQEKLDEAIQYYEKVTEETDTETAAKARFMIGECYFARKNHKEASRHFLKAAFSYGHKEWSAMSWFEAARCFEVLRDIDQAKNCYQQMIEKFPEHSKVPDAKKRLAEL